jgi:type IV pilus assembly protein PilA
MKNNKKGFTLVELLAVIVILAIIALIATPIILNVIDDAKTNAAKNSAYGYIDALEKVNAQDMLSSESINVLSGVYTISNDGTLTHGEKAVTVKFKGTKPTGGTLTYADGKLSSGSSIIVDGKTFTSDADGKLTLSTGK